nr:hypothetical protein [Tanacetum cinerariifolium]
MDMTIDQQMALDEALVPYASRLRIEKSNFRLRSDITSKESTLQLEMLYICPRFPGQTFDELPFEEEILAFLRFLGHSGEIRKLTDAQILWGMYHKKNVDYAYLLWEDFVYQVKHKDAKKSNEMYYPRHQNIQQFGVMLPIERTNEAIRNYEAYKEYYAVASGAAPPKTKASVRKMKSSSDTIVTPLTAACTRLLTFVKGKQVAKAFKAKNEGTGSIPGVLDVPTDESDEEIYWKSSDEDDDDDDDQDTDDEGDEFIHPKLTIHEEEETKDEESFDPVVLTPENSDDEGNDDASQGLNVDSEEGQDTEDDEDELYRDVNINLAGRDVQMTDVHTTQEFKDTHVTLTLVNPNGQQQSSSVSSQFVTHMLNPSPDARIDSIFEPTPQMDVPASTTVSSLTLSAPTLTPPTIPTISRVPQEPNPPTTTPSTLLQDLPNFGSLFRFDHRLKTLEANFSEFMQTNQFARAIIKEQVKEQVKVQVSKILPKLEKTVNKQLEAEVLTRSSNSSKTPYVALVEAYESDKIILDTYKDVMMMRTKMKNPSLDQTGGLRDEEKEKSQSKQALQRRKLPSLLASLHKGLNLNKRLQASLHQQRSQCRQLKIWKSPHIKSLKQIVKWHNYKHLDWITVRRDDAKLYKFKKGDFKRLRIQDIKDMLLLLVQGKLINLTTKERFAFNVSLRMFTRSIVIQWRIEDLQLGVESYQKKLNLTKPDTYRSDLKRKEAYTAYSNPRGFIYQNKDKQNRLMRIDELHKFNDGTLNNVRTDLDDRLKGIQMKYMRQAI